MRFIKKFFATIGWTIFVLATGLLLSMATIIILLIQLIAHAS